MLRAPAVSASPPITNLSTKNIPLPRHKIMAQAQLSSSPNITKHHQPLLPKHKLCSSSGAAAKALRASGSGAIEDQDALRGRKRSTALRPAPRTIQSCRCLDPRSPKGPEICNLNSPLWMTYIDSKRDQQIKPYQQCQSLPETIVCRESVLSLSLSFSLHRYIKQLFIARLQYTERHLWNHRKSVYIEEDI